MDALYQNHLQRCFSGSIPYLYIIISYNIYIYIIIVIYYRPICRPSFVLFIYYITDCSITVYDIFLCTNACYK